MKLSAPRRILAAASLAVLVGARVGIARDPPAPAQRLPAPAHVTSAARAELRARMGEHGAAMSGLMRAVVLLDRPSTRALAGRIADEEVIARTSRSVHDPLPFSLPREFFLQQTRLVVGARDLGVAAAEGSDDRVLAERFAAITGTCVACHSAYLHAAPDR